MALCSFVLLLASAGFPRATATQSKKSFEDLGLPNSLGGTAPLTEDGYQLVASLSNNDDMKVFIRRLLSLDELSVLDEGALGGFSPYFSGALAVQSLGAMQQELSHVDWVGKKVSTSADEAVAFSGSAGSSAVGGSEINAHSEEAEHTTAHKAVGARSMLRVTAAAQHAEAEEKLREFAARVGKKDQGPEEVAVTETATPRDVEKTDEIPETRTLLHSEENIVPEEELKEIADSWPLVPPAKSNRKRQPSLSAAKSGQQRNSRQPRPVQRQARGNQHSPRRAVPYAPAEQNEQQQQQQHEVLDQQQEEVQQRHHVQKQKQQLHKSSKTHWQRSKSRKAQNQAVQMSKHKPRRPVTRLDPKLAAELKTLEDENQTGAAELGTPDELSAEERPDEPNLSPAEEEDADLPPWAADLDEKDMELAANAGVTTPAPEDDQVSSLSRAVEAQVEQASSPPADEAQFEQAASPLAHEAQQDQEQAQKQAQKHQQQQQKQEPQPRKSSNVRQPADEAARHTVPKKKNTPAQESAAADSVPQPDASNRSAVRHSTAVRNFLQAKGSGDGLDSKGINERLSEVAAIQRERFRKDAMLSDAKLQALKKQNVEAALVSQKVESDVKALQLGIHVLRLRSEQLKAAQKNLTNQTHALLRLVESQHTVALRIKQDLASSSDDAVEEVGSTNDEAGVTKVESDASFLQLTNQLRDGVDVHQAAQGKNTSQSSAPLDQFHAVSSKLPNMFSTFVNHQMDHYIAERRLQSSFLESYQATLERHSALIIEQKALYMKKVQLADQYVAVESTVAKQKQLQVQTIAKLADLRQRMHLAADSVQ